MPVDPAGRALAGVGPLAEVRQGAAADPRPPRPRLLLRPDARGGHHRHRAPGRQELPPAAVQPLPDPDQVPRRDPPALRPDARPRVPDEGRLLLPRRRREPRRGLRRDARAPTAGSSRPAGSTTPWSRPTPARSAARRRTSSWSPRRPARARSCTAPPAATPRTSRRPSARPWAPASGRGRRVPPRETTTPGHALGRGGRPLPRAWRRRRFVKTLVYETDKGLRRGRRSAATARSTRSSS